jgi:hypothetical protein
MIKIYYWADGTWCYEEHLHEYDWMSDDYAIIEVSEWMPEEQIDIFIHTQI